MSKSKTAAAADKAVAKSQKKTEVEKTPQEIVADVRNLVTSGLYVPVRSVKVLLDRYDAAVFSVKSLSGAVTASDDLITELQLQLSGVEAKYNRLTAEIEIFEKQQLQRLESVVADPATTQPEDMPSHLELHRLADDGGPVIE